jgi:hypothetical protein
MTNIPTVLTDIYSLVDELWDNHKVLQKRLALICSPYQRSVPISLEPIGDLTPLEAELIRTESLLDAILEDLEKIVTCVKL